MDIKITGVDYRFEGGVEGEMTGANVRFNSTHHQDGTLNGFVFLTAEEFNGKTNDELIAEVKVKVKANLA